MHSLIQAHQQPIAALCRHYRVRRLEVFGSAARGTDFDPDRSDVDFLVEFEPVAESGPLEQFFGFRSALSDLLGRSVDLVETSALRNPYLRAVVNRTREWVYGA